MSGAVVMSSAASGTASGTVSAAASGGGTRATMLVIGVLLVGVGLLNLLKPDLGWRLSTRKEDATTPRGPSEAALMTARASGAAFIAIGALLVVIGVIG